MKLKFLAVLAAALLVSALARAEDASPSSLTEAFDQWTLRCSLLKITKPADDTLKKEDLGAKPKDDKPPAPVEKRVCTVSQQFVTTGQGGQGIFVGQVAFSYDLKKTSQLNLQLDAPVEVLVDKPIKLADGEKPFASSNFHSCAGNSCSAFIENAAAMATSLATSTTPRLIYTLANGQDFGVNFSVKGLNTALAALKAQQK